MTQQGVAEIVRKAWGDRPPDWIRALRDELLFTSQGKLGKRLGVQGGVIGQCLRGTYNGGRMDGPEARVRTVLMREEVTCPKLGEIELRACHEWSQKATAYSSNPLRVRMSRACRNCPHNPQARKDAFHADRNTKA